MNQKKPLFEGISSNMESSIYISHQFEKDIMRKDYWHFHNNYELVFVPSGKGKRHVAQRVTDYDNGDLILLSPNTSHNTLIKEHIGQKFEQYVILFDFTLFHRFFMICKEFGHIPKLFQDMGAGLAFHGDTKKEVGALIKDMNSSKSFEKIIFFFKMLDKMANSKEYKQLGPSDSFDMPKIQRDKIRFVNEYINRNYREKLFSSEMSSIIGMTNSSFCRFYKKSTGKTFKRALNEIRIQNSCFLLKNSKMTIEAVALESGFPSIPLFYKFFNKIMSQKPSEYRGS